MAQRGRRAAREDFLPLTLDRWEDFARLFGPRGACAGCWCMWWRSKRAEFEKRGNSGNRRAMRAVVQSGEVPGILAYLAGKPVGWCAVAPRESHGSLERSRVLKRLDHRPVWSIVCFFVAREQRGSGLMQRLIRAAVDHVRAQGGDLVEAYPTRPRGRRLEAVSSFMGTPEVFEAAGFVECARPSEAKAVMRYEIRRRPRARRR